MQDPTRTTDRIEVRDVWKLYDEHAEAFDRDRSRSLFEKRYLLQISARLRGNGTRVLDLGCGGGEPIARFFIEAGCQVTGVDASPRMIELCRRRFPDHEWLATDMRALELDRRFDAIVAWDSFFHLRPDEQRAMFPIFQRHIAPSGCLLFTAGPRPGEVEGDFYGSRLYHASLAAEEYQGLLAIHGFQVLLHRVQDAACHDHTVWLAQEHAPSRR